MTENEDLEHHSSACKHHDSKPLGVSCHTNEHIHTIGIHMNYCSIGLLKHHIQKQELILPYSFRRIHHGGEAWEHVARTGS